MKKITNIAMAFVMMTVFTAAISGARENSSPQIITPGEDISSAEIMSSGKTFSFKDDMEGKDLCSPGNMMFCIEKDEKYACVKWTGQIRFTFVPVDDSSTSPIKVMGYSSNKEKYPEKEYEIVPCEK